MPDMKAQPGIYRLLLRAALICLLTATAQAQQIVLTGNEARAPKMSKAVNGQAEGVLVEVMKYVEEITPLRFAYVLFPWARAYKTAIDGETGIIGISRTKEREELFDFSSEPVFYDDLVLVVKAGNEFAFNSSADLKGRRIGVCNGCSYGESYDLAVKSKHFEPVPGSKVSAQLLMLLNDRLDAVLVPVGSAGLAEALRDPSAHKDLSQRRDSFSILNKPFSRDPNYIAFAKSMGKRKVLQTIDLALKKGHETGAIQARINAYIQTRQ